MSWAKGRPKQGATARGYGHRDHVVVRQRRVDALRDGDACAQCRTEGKYHPMFRSQIPKLHLSHNDARTGHIGLSLSERRGEGCGWDAVFDRLQEAT